MQIFNRVVFLGFLSLASCGNSNSRSETQSWQNGQRIGRFLQPVQVPSRVRTAIAEVTHLGRSEGDFFGFESFRVYQLVESAAQPHLKSILADVIDATRDQGEYSLAQFCMTGTDSQGRTLMFDDRNECAAYLAGYEKNPRINRVLTMLPGVYAQASAGAERMSAAVGHIKAYLSQKVGSDFEEISISMTGLNVSEETVVLINKNTGYVVVITFNLGA